MRFTYTAELNEKVAIRPDGAISLPVIGEVPVQGLTPAQLSSDLTSRYGKYYKRPDVVVLVREFAERRAYVGGEVASPGVVILKGTPVTCLQAVLSAGGAKSSAGLEGAVLLRQTGQQTATIRRLNLKRVMHGLDPDVRLRPFDIVLIPRSRIGKLNLFVEQYINGLLPRNIVFPYNLNTTFTIE